MISGHPYKGSVLLLTDNSSLSTPLTLDICELKISKPSGSEANHKLNLTMDRLIRGWTLLFVRVGPFLFILTHRI